MLGFVLLLAAKLVVLRLFALSSWSVLGTLADFVFVFVLVALVDLLFSDMRFRAMVVTDAVLSVLLLAIGTFVSYYQLIPTRESLATIGQAGTVGTSIASLLSIKYLLFFVDVPLLVAWEIRAGKRRIDPITLVPAGSPVAPGARTPYVYQRKAVYVVATLAGVALALNVQYVRGLGPGGNSEMIARDRGLATYLAASIIGAKPASPSDVLAVDRLQARLNELSMSDAGQARAGYEPGAHRGSNVIIVQLEAVQSAAVGARVNQRPVTPALDRLIQRSWYFPNHISQVGLGTTSDAEFAVNTSLYPCPTRATALTYVDRVLPSLPRLLRAKGYDAYTLHTNSVDFWNRSQLYPALGFSEYFDSAYFGSEDKIVYGASDEVLYEKTLARLLESRRAGRPFYAHVIAMSSHFPFVGVPASKRVSDFASSEFAGTIEGDYLTEVNYADRALGEFVDELEKSGLLDESILVIYGDHFGLPEPRSAQEQAALLTLLGHEYTVVDRMMTPLVVRLPGQTKGERVTDPVGQVDVMPTVADALGIDIAPTPHVGRSVLATGRRIVSPGALFPVGSYVDGDTVYIPGDVFETGTAWSISRRETIGLDAAEPERYENMREIQRLVDTYARGLPARDDYNADASYVVPKE